MKEMTLYPVADMQKMAEAIAKSGLFGMKTPEQALALMIVAQSEGKLPGTITKDYHIIQGRAAIKSESLQARFQSMGGKVEWHKLTDEVASATLSHPAGGSLKITWTIEQAIRAGLAGKENWKKYPRPMLRARCISEGIRAVYPAAIGGMLTEEEAQDMPRAEIDAGDAEVIPEPKSAADKMRAQLEVLEAEPEPDPEALPFLDLDPEVDDLPPAALFDDLMFKLANCESVDEFHSLVAEGKVLYLDLDKGQKAALTKLINARREELSDADSDA